MLLLQETASTIIQNSDSDIGKALDFGAIGFNIIIMMLTVAILLGAYSLRSYNSEVAALEWVKSNKFRWFVGLVMIFGLSALMVITPDINIALTAIGFNTEKSPVALGVAITLLLIGATSEPTKVPKGSL